MAPAELENLLRKHPNVADVAVIGIPDDRAGEVPRAYVVLTPGSNITPEVIEDFLAGKVAPHKRLEGGVYFINELPKTASGKICKRKLKAEALKEW